ncbi:MAG TPA: MFS transporter [Streptosporangiaceae bacterium]|nr:MFS transporter [Streptosporangiaceae bacterium]
MSGTRRWPPRVFLAGQAVSLLGDGLAVLAIPLLVLDLTRSPLISGISAASVTIGYLFVGLPAGVLIDRLDPWRVLIAMDAARAVLFGTLFGLAVARLLAVWLILVVALVAGACAVFFETALVVVVRDLFAGPGLIRANSLIEVASQVSLIVGPAAVGVLAAAGRLRAALLADALTFLVSLVSLAVVARRTPRRPPGRGGTAPRAGPGRLGQLAGDVRDGLRYLASVRLLVIMTAMQVVVNLCLSVEKLIIYDAQVTLGLRSGLVGLVVAAGGAGGLLGAVSAAPLARWVSEIRLIAAAIAAAGVAVTLLGVAGSFPGLALANLGYGWALVVASLVNRTQRQRIVPRALLGRVTSTVRMIFLATDPLGVLIAGAVTAALGGDPRPVFLVAGLIVTLTAAVGWLAGLRAAAKPRPG